MPRDRDTRLKVPTLCFGAGAVGLGALIYHLSRVEYRDAKRRIEVIHVSAPGLPRDSALTALAGVTASPMHVHDGGA